MHDGHEHAHPARPDREDPKGYYQVMATALRELLLDRKSTRLNSSHIQKSRMPSSA